MSISSFSELVNKAIEVQSENVMGHDIFALSSLDFAKEFKTIKIDVGRRTGKTSYIRENATENDLVIVPAYFPKEAYSDSKATILFITELKRNSSFNRIFIEMPVYFADIDKIYELFANDDIEQKFIFLG